jgi:hypothetical protein
VQCASYEKENNDLMKGKFFIAHSVNTFIVIKLRIDKILKSKKTIQFSYFISMYMAHYYTDYHVFTPE